MLSIVMLSVIILNVVAPKTRVLDSWGMYNKFFLVICSFFAITLSIYLCQKFLSLTNSYRQSRLGHDPNYKYLY
jgi:hypothetical protein